VVRAGDAAALGHVADGEQFVASVPTRVREHPQGRTVLDQESRDVADDDGALRDRPRPGGGREQVEQATQACPAAREEVPLLPRQHLRGGVGLAGQHAFRLPVASCHRPSNDVERVDVRLGHGPTSCRRGFYAARHGKSPVTRRDRRAVEVRREEILVATTDLLDRIGLASIRVADVAKDLGVSTALVFYHFGTKDTLVAEAFAHAVDRDLRRLDQATAKGSDPMDRLRRVLRLYGPTGQATGWRVWIDAWALAQREPLIRRVLRRLDQRWSAALLKVIEDGVAEGTFTCSDAEAAVARISALLDGLSVATLVYRTVTRAQLRHWVAGAVAGELGLDAEALV